MDYTAVVIDNCITELQASVEKLNHFGVFKQVLPFSEPHLAIDYMDTYGCDVVFTEVDMKNINGFQLARRYGKKNITMCFVFLTSNERYAMEALNLHITDYILKPIEVGNIERIIKKIKNKQYFEI